MRFIHLLSKEARLKLLDLLLISRGKKELAEELGLSPASITKYLTGLMHPSDNTVKKMINIMSSRERARAYEIILEDLALGLEELLREIKDHITTFDKDARNTIKTTLGELVLSCESLIKELNE